MTASNGINNDGRVHQDKIGCTLYQGRNYSRIHNKTGATESTTGAGGSVESSRFFLKRNN